jgi:hypothetical protein
VGDNVIARRNDEPHVIARRNDEPHVIARRNDEAICSFYGSTKLTTENTKDFHKVHGGSSLKGLLWATPSQ